MLITRVWISVYYLPLILIVSELWSNINCQTPGYEIHIEPYVQVQRGLCAHVSCTFTVPRDISLSRNTNGFWHRLLGETSHLAAARGDSTYYTNGRFYLIGNATRGDCSLYIQEPLSADEGVYYFRIENPQTRFTYGNIRPYMNVTELKDKPSISSTRLVDGNKVTMSCISPGRCWNITTPHISWEGAMTDIRQKNYKITYKGGNSTYSSKITFTPRKSHNNSPLFCTMTFKEDLSTVENQTLNVEYSPSISITSEGVDTNDATAVIVKDGDSVTLQCIVDSNPKASITWYKEDRMVYRSISDQIVTIQLINFIKSDAGKYQCSAMNEHGVTQRSIEIIYQDAAEVLDIITILLIIGAICLLLLVLLIAYACWRHRLKNLRSTETEDTYTNLRRSQITETYDKLQFHAHSDNQGSVKDNQAANYYENVP